MSKKRTIEDLEPLYTIKQASDFTGIPDHTLRFWERAFPNVLKPGRVGRQRRYNKESLATILKIKELTETGWYTTEGIAHHLAGGEFHEKTK